MLYLQLHPQHLQGQQPKDPALTLIHVYFLFYFIPLTLLSATKWKCSLAQQWKSPPLKYFTAIRLASQNPMPIKPDRGEEQESKTKTVTSQDLSSILPSICTDACISREKNKTRLQQHNKNPRHPCLNECFLTKIKYAMNEGCTSY